jgi:2-keto-3-deoxy-L-rhamnonate aldolase RhmA
MTETLKNRLRSGLPSIGAWSTISSPSVAEAMASCGFHWLAADMEHGAIDLGDLPALFAVAERHGATPLVRLPCADPYLARRVLDAGAQGLIVPVVESAEAFSAFARHCFYPPAGRRGVGLCRGNLWGDRFETHLNDFSPVLIPQIETRAGVEAAAAIAALDVVDGLFIGPYDLSADLGTPGRFDTPEMAGAMARVNEAATAAGKARGIHQVPPDPAQLRARLAEGYRFVAYATDITAMRAALGRPLEVAADLS